MKTLLSELERNISEEILVQQSIQELLDCQLDVLLQGGTERLPAILESAEAGIEESRRLEAVRDEIIRRIADRLGRPVHEISLQSLENVLGDAASPLHDKGDELREIIVRIRERNREVSLLVRHSLVFIEDLIRVVTGSDQMRSDTYTAAGRTQETPSSALAAEG